MNPDIFHDFEKPGPFEEAADSFKGGDEDWSFKVVDRSICDVHFACRRECPKLRLSLVVEVKTVDTDPDDCDDALLLALEQYCQRVRDRRTKRKATVRAHQIVAGLAQLADSLREIR